MSLLTALTLRIVLVAFLCFASALAWIVVDTQRAAEAEAVGSVNRVARQLESFYLLGSWGKGLFSNRESIALVAIMAPGVCVVFQDIETAERRVCSGWNTLGPVAPDWFRELFKLVFTPALGIEAMAKVHGEPDRPVVGSFDPVAAATRAWNQFRIVAGLAAAMAIAMSLLTAAAIAHALLPVQAIIKGLRQLESGDHASRLPHLRIAEFRRIGTAVNDLASRLERTTGERSALTRRLFQVQEEERKTLARELHDEFGQCLTAAGALAASIEAGSPPDRGDLCDDARAISRITAQMMATLRGAFARLRPPDLEELGLEASLRNMVRAWNVSLGSRTRFDLRIEGELAALPPQAALDVYRIVQECLTNAARHGSPGHVSVRVSRNDAAADIMLVVEDDGGGSPGDVSAAPGFGILGIRERIGSVGGSLSIGRSAGGIRMSAVIPAGGAIA